MNRISLTALILILLFCAGCETLTGNDDYAETQDIGAVDLSTYDEPVLLVNQYTLDMAYDLEEASVMLENGGDSLLTWEVRDQLPSWITIEPRSGSLAGGDRTFINLQVSREGQTAGKKTGVVQIDAGDAGMAEFSVSMRIHQEVTLIPSLFAAPNMLEFSYELTRLQFGVSNEGTGSLNFEVTESTDWLTITADSLTAPANVTVSVDRTGLEPGEYNGEITVSSNAGTKVVSVSMLVREPEPVDEEPITGICDVSGSKVTWRPNERHTVLGNCSVGGHFFHIEAEHGLLWGGADEEPNSVHFKTVMVEIVNGTAEFRVLVEYTGDQKGQRSESFALKVNGTYLDRGTGSPVVPDSPSYKGQVEVYAGSLVL